MMRKLVRRSAARKRGAKGADGGEKRIRTQSQDNSGEAPMCTGTQDMENSDVLGDELDKGDQVDKYMD